MIVMRTNSCSCVHTVWHLVGGSWLCFDGLGKSDFFNNILLSDYLAGFGISIPDYVRYCIIETDAVCVKFRQTGNLIHVYVIIY